MTSLEGSNPVYRGPRTAENTHVAVDPELGDGEDEELLSPHPHPHFSQRAPWLRAGVLGVRFPAFCTCDAACMVLASTVVSAVRSASPYLIGGSMPVNLSNCRGGPAVVLLHVR